MSLYRQGLPNRGITGHGWNNKTVSAKKMGKLGDMSLKSTLSVLLMAGAMALFASIEQAL